MKTEKTERKSREDWLAAGFQVLQERGVSGLKVVHVAKRLGITTGSFYWHFKDVNDLLDSLLDHWEHRLTGHIITDAMAFAGPPQERILNLMLQVIEEDAALHDQSIAIWSRSNPAVRDVLDRTLQKRFDFATWMFKQAGFKGRDASTRGRLMVTYLMGESVTGVKSKRNWKSIIRDEFELIARPSE